MRIRETVFSVVQRGIIFINRYIIPEIILIIMQEHPQETADPSPNCNAPEYPGTDVSSSFCTDKNQDKTIQSGGDSNSINDTSGFSGTGLKTGEKGFRNNRISAIQSPAYIDRLLDYMPTYYVTLVSIIQSIALGLLFGALYNEMSGLSRGTFDPVWTILILGTFFIIMSIWITYTRLTSAMRVIPQTLDGIIPFFFGLTEALSIFCISLHEVVWFYFSLVFLAAVAIVQYLHSFHQAHVHFEKNREFLEKIGSWDKNAIMMAVARGLFFIVFGCTAAFFPQYSLFIALIFLCMNIVLIIFLHWSFRALSEY
jgi:hypothetical protein